MLTESLNQFKFGLKRFQKAFNLNDLFKRSRHLVQQLCWTHVQANVETV